MALGFGFLKGGVEADLVDGAEGVGADAQFNPHVLLYPIEFLTVQVDIESAFGAALGVRHIVAHLRFSACNLTNF